MEDFKISKLEDAVGWTLWKFQVKVVLRASNLWNIINGSKKKPETAGKDLEEWNLLDAKAQKILVVSMGEEPMLHIMNCESAEGMWSVLESIYEQKCETSIHLLQQQFFQYSKAPEDAISVHISKLQKMAKQLEDLGEKITDNMLITKILMTLPQEYKHFFSSWESTGKTERTLKNLTSRLCMEESRLGIQPLKSEAFTARHNNPKFSGKYTPNQGKQKPKGKCYKCGEFGHWKRDCPNKTDGKVRKDGDAFIGERLFLESTTSEENTWYVDSGASDHMCNKRHWFKNYIDFDKPRSIRVGNGAIIPAFGTGDINIQAFDGSVWRSKFLSGVLYVPDIKLNLFSTNACLDKGFIMEAEADTCVFKRDGKVCLKGIRENSRLFKLLLKVEYISSGETNVAATNYSLQTWHERMCHQDKNHVRNILDRQQIKYTGNDFFCEGCIMGKQHRNPFVESVNRAEAIGGLVHTDLCGPMQETSFGGSRYMVLFRDDYSNYRHVFCVKEKSDVPEIIAKYLDQVEADTGKKVKALRSDNGVEYCNKEVCDILRKHKITHQRSTPYTPEHNGRAERDMRTIVEASRTMIHGNNLSLNYWGEAVSNAVYTLNRTGKSPQKDKSPYELWFGKPTDISTLHVFGSEAYVHIPDEKRRKWDAKSKKGVFVGYQENCKGYRVWVPQEKRIAITRNVVIRENHNEVAIREVCNEECTTTSKEPRVISVSDSNDEFEDAVNEIDDDNIANVEKDIRTQKPTSSRYMLRSRTHSADEDRNYCAFVADTEEPQGYHEAVNSNHKAQWKNAMDEEYNSLVDNDTWTLVDLPQEKSAISNKWVYKIKRNHEGDIERYKARLVVRGFTQKFGIDYQETFSPVAKFTSVRMILALSVSNDYHLIQFDIKTAFLYGHLDEEVFMEQPFGYSDGSNKVCKLNRSLYGLKQASRCWNKRFTEMLRKFNFKATDGDPCVFTGSIKDKKIVLAIYIDDGIIAAECKEVSDEFISYLKGEFDVKVFSTLYYLGMEIRRDASKIHICQTGYIKKLLRKFNMHDARPVSTPVESVQSTSGRSNEIKFPYREAVGSLMYLAIATRPDIAFAVSYVSRFLDSFNEHHVTAVKRIFKYLRGTDELGIEFVKETNVFLNCYTDSDYAGDPATRRSTSGYVIMLSGGPITWSSRKQSTIALSTTEAEYISACEGVKELVWVQRLFQELQAENVQIPNLYLDNQSSIKLIKNPQFHKRTKHIEVKYHFVREMHEKNEFQLKYISTTEQLADICTKPIMKQQFNNLKQMLNIKKF